MKKQLKVIFILMAIILVIITAGLVGYKVINQPKELSKMNFEFKMDNIENFSLVSKDDFGNLNNNSSELSEEVFLDENIGMYDFSVTGDEKNTIITYKVKNHSDKKIEKFEYELNFLNSSLEKIDSLKLNSQEIPKKCTYQVEIKIEGSVLGVYKLMPVFSDKAVGKKGVINNEIS